ncbi:hypothetical protein ACFFX0_22015 [Citricoccus parietis]|uniref:Uncharacterized protein n=1 Tax=Citricoccus parietis TaxID=592307 RepID=A0ABV5G481_9MICC
MKEPEVPSAPPRRLTVADITLLVGLPLVAYVGGLGAAFGHGAGLVLSGFAALGMIAFRSFRINRRNEPRIPSYTHYVAMAVAVITFVTSWNLYRIRPESEAVIYLAPAAPMVLFGLLVALMFRRPR